jgi:hypothetical protein
MLSLSLTLSLSLWLLLCVHIIVKSIFRQYTILPPIPIPMGGLSFSIAGYEFVLGATIQIDAKVNIQFQAMINSVAVGADATAALTARLQYGSDFSSGGTLNPNQVQPSFHVNPHPVTGNAQGTFMV